jgi:hypothetical protein
MTKNLWLPLTLLTLTGCGGFAPEWEVLGEIRALLDGEPVSWTDFGIGTEPDELLDGVRQHRPAEEWTMWASGSDLTAQTQVPHPAGQVRLSTWVTHPGSMEPDVPYVTTRESLLATFVAPPPTSGPPPLEHPTAGWMSDPEDDHGESTGDADFADRVTVTLRQDDVGARRYEVVAETTWRDQPFVYEAWFDEVLCQLSGVD